MRENDLELVLEEVTETLWLKVCEFVEDWLEVGDEVELPDPEDEPLLVIVEDNDPELETVTVGLELKVRLKVVEKVRLGELLAL